MISLTCKRWSLLSAGGFVFVILLTVAMVVFVDPFEIYHQATLFIPPINNTTQSYSNAGIAKNYDYDSVIIGSSMTENFLPSELNKQLGGNFVKLCINGGSPFNHRQMLDMAFSTHDIKQVLYCIDIDMLTYFYTQAKADMPEYLYDDNLFNDVHYWFNKDVLATYIPRTLKTWGKQDASQRDTMYSWGSLYTYGREAALRHVSSLEKNVPQKEAPDNYSVSQQTKLNIEHNYLPIIESHPETQFIFFFPPYSLVRWYEFYTYGDLDYHLSQCAAVANVLLSHENVSIFDFRSRLDWICNFDNYIDSYHYGPWINSKMVSCIARKEEQIVSAEEVQQNSEIIQDAVRDLLATDTWPSYPSAE